MKHYTRFLLLLIFSFCLLGVAVFIFFHNGKTDFDGEVEVTSEKLILGFSQIGSESAWRTRNTQSIFEAAEKNNIQIIYDDAQQKQSNQLKAIRSFIVYQVDVIAFVPIVDDGWDKVLQEAKAANIPVIIVDRKIKSDPSLYAGFLGENSFEEGKAAGEYLLKKVAENATDSINIIELYGTENSSVAFDRSEGFKNSIKENPNLKIIYSESGDFLRSRGKEIMDKIIANNDGMLLYKGQKIDAIFSHNDSMTLGILDSFKQNQITPINVLIISIDAEQKIIDALTQKKINCVVECNPNQGPTLMKLVQQIARGEKIPRETFMEKKIFTDEDDFSTYTPRGY